MYSVRTFGPLTFRCCMWATTTLAAAMVVAHFFGTGPYWHDAGWFSYLLDSNPGLINPDGSSFYTVHVSPLLSVVSGLNCVVRVPRPMPMMLVLFGSFLIIASATYRIFLAVPTAASAVLLSTVIMSRQVFEFFRYPHYEIMGLAFFMVVWAAVHANRHLPAILGLVLLLMVREDMGLHVGLLFLSVWAGLRTARETGDGHRYGAPTLVVRIAICAILYAIAAFAVQWLVSRQTGSMVERAIIGTGRQISWSTAFRNLMTVARGEAFELAFLVSLLAVSPSRWRLLNRLLLLAPYGLWSVVCAVSQNPAMAKQGAYYSFPLFFVLVVAVTSAVWEWAALKGWARASILLLAALLLGSRALELRQHEVRLCADTLSPSMKTFENVGAWRKLSGTEFGAEVIFSHACASLWVTPASVARTINLDSMTAMPEKPLLFMEHEHGADQFFRKCLREPGEAYAINGSSFILWVPESHRGFLGTLPIAANATRFNVFTRSLIVVPPATRVDGDLVIAREQTGCCFYGPYVGLAAGKYRIRGKAEPSGANQFVRFDCVAQGHQPIVAQARWNGCEFSVEFELDSDVREFEFRGWSNNPPTGLRLDDVELARDAAGEVAPPEAPLGSDP